jgi:hypothetical protein
MERMLFALCKIVIELAFGRDPDGEPGPYFIGIFGGCPGGCAD